MQLVLGVLIAIALVATLVSFTLGLFAQRFIGIEVDAADRPFGRESKRAAETLEGEDFWSRCATPAGTSSPPRVSRAAIAFLSVARMRSRAVASIALGSR